MSEPGRPRSKIFFPNDWLGVAPTILNLLRAFSDRGYGMDVYAATMHKQFPEPEVPADARIFEIPSVEDIPERPVGAAAGVRAIQDVLTYPLHAFAESETSVPSAFNVGVDCLGALAARFRQLVYGEPYVFLSLELPTRPRDSVMAQLAFRAEYDAFSNAAAVIIQDEDRGRALARYFGHAHHNQLLLPNGPPDAPHPLKAPVHENFFRRKFGLEAERHPHIVAHAGMILSDACMQELATAIKGVPEFTFIFHERRRRSVDEPEIARIRALGADNLFLSLDPVPYNRLGEIYSSIDIGITYYRPYNDNQSEMAFASGKLAFYLRHGIPVVVNNLPSFVRLLEKYEFGTVISNPASSSELSGALKRIVASYDHYSRNARECFLKEFNFSDRAAPLFAYFDTLRP